MEHDEFKNGVFTHGLISSLSDKLVDRNRDGQIVLPELIRKTRRFVHKFSKSGQTPEISGSELSFQEVPIAKVLRSSNTDEE